MVVFWILASAMTLAALGFVLVPLLRTRAVAGPTASAVNLAVLRAQRREIETDVAAGTLAPDAREEALQELVQRAADDLAPADEPVTAALRRPWGLAIAVGLLVPAAAFALYLALGTPQAADPVLMAAARGNPDQQQVVALVESLARKVRERPDDAQGWALLARSMAALGRFTESADAYDHLVTLVPNDPQILADYADSLGMAQGRSLKGKPYTLVKAALAIDPDQRKALALAGTAALDEGDFAAAIAHWERLAALMPPDSPDAPQVQTILAEVRERAAKAGAVVPAASVVVAAKATAPVAAAPAPATSTPQATAGGADGRVTGQVALAPAMATRVKGDETLFIFARAENGPRMPLAILRTGAGKLPMQFALDDSLSMTPTARLSTASAVRIEARISRSGNAMPQAGDLVGSSEVVKPGARDVRIVVDKVVP